MTDQLLPNIIQLIEQLQRALALKDAATLQRLTDAYINAYLSLKGKIEALATKIELEGGVMTKGQIQRLAQYGQLMDAVEEQVTKYSVYLETELNMTAKDAIASASRDAKIILAELLGNEAELIARVQSLNPRIVENLVAFLDPGGELYKRIQFYGEEAASRVSDAIITHVTLGRNPRVLGRFLRDRLGWTLTDALRTARTVQLYSYREASRANYIANNNIVKGWIWYAQLDGKTCASCIAKHGSFHTLDERLADHYNGRCAMLPVTITNPNPDIRPGEDWFREQPEQLQSATLGKGKYKAWSEGQFEFSKLSKEVPDAVYQSMWVETPLKELISVDNP